jgi:hypothetical protein
MRPAPGMKGIKQRRPHTDLFDNEHLTTRLILLNHKFSKTKTPKFWGSCINLLKKTAGR